MHLDVLVISFQPIDSGLHGQLVTLGVPDNRVTHIPAVDVSEDPRWTASPKRGRIGPGAAGCLLAHRDAWSTWLSLDGRSDMALVLEDDASITDYGRRWTTTCIEDFSSEGLELLQLGVVPQAGVLKALTTKSAANVFSVVNSSLEQSNLMNKRRPQYSRLCGWGTHAYLISASCADMLLTWDFGFLMPIDSWFRALSYVPARKFARTRQMLWSANGRASMIDQMGR